MSETNAVKDESDRNEVERLQPVVKCTIAEQIRKRYENMTPEEKYKEQMVARKILKEKLEEFERTGKATAITAVDRLRHYTI